MCGIVGYTGKQKASGLLLESLKRLEYRGYDSAGIAVINKNIQLFRNTGNIDALETILPPQLQGNTGIAHTRWATHGRPTVENAHPHLSASGQLVMVHNGIIENDNKLKAFLQQKGISFKSETDTEVLLNLVDYFMCRKKLSLHQAVKNAVSKVEGRFAIALIKADEPEKIYAIRRGSPLIAAQSETGCFLASDSHALAPYTDQISFLQDEDLVELSPEGITAYNSAGDIIELKKGPVHHAVVSSGKGDFEHFMLKEIYEQPHTLSVTLDRHNGMGTPLFPELQQLSDKLKTAKRIIIIGCGTSWHSGLIGEYLIERFARISVEVEYASEFRYRHPVINADDIVISISQSGETADTLAANQLAREAHAITIAISNVPYSSLARETDALINQQAGPEIGVASTKAFTSQVAILTQLALYFADLKGTYGDIAQNIQYELQSLPAKIEETLNNQEMIKELAKKYVLANNFLFLGRGINFPIALEGALKLKEISYIHAEGYPGAEMKHGPIALIDHMFPSIAIATDQANRTKMISNIREIQARNGQVIVIGRNGDKELQQLADSYIGVADTIDALTPIVSIIPLQLFSYYMAIFRNCNVDQPRNLAKSVTVE